MDDDGDDDAGYGAGQPCPECGQPMPAQQAAPVPAAAAPMRRPPPKRSGGGKKGGKAGGSKSHYGHGHGFRSA